MDIIRNPDGGHTWTGKPMKVKTDIRRVHLAFDQLTAYISELAAECQSITDAKDPDAEYAEFDLWQRRTNAVNALRRRMSSTRGLLGGMEGWN